MYAAGALAKLGYEFRLTFVKLVKLHCADPEAMLWIVEGVGHVARATWCSDRRRIRKKVLSGRTLVVSVKGSMFIGLFVRVLKDQKNYDEVADAVVLSTQTLGRGSMPMWAELSRIKSEAAARSLTSESCRERRDSSIRGKS